MIENYIAAGVSAGVVVAIANITLTMFARQEMKLRNREHMKISIMIAVNQVRAQKAESVAYTEDQFENLLNQEIP